MSLIEKFDFLIRPYVKCSYVKKEIKLEDIDDFNPRCKRRYNNYSIFFWESLIGPDGFPKPRVYFVVDNNTGEIAQVNPFKLPFNWFEILEKA